MPRYAAFLRGVMPTNVKMTALKAAFESAGFEDVKTVLGSGNVVFSARAASEAALARKAEAAMERELGRVFPAIVRSLKQLRALLEADPFRRFTVPAGAKRVVTFLRTGAPANLKPPIEYDGARILAVDGLEVFTAYQRTASNPAFMTLIEKTLGKEVTTRTWETLQKVAGSS